MQAHGIGLPPDPEPIDAVFDFTFNKTEVGYGWVAVAAAILVLWGVWSAWELRKA